MRERMGGKGVVVGERGGRRQQQQAWGLTRIVDSIFKFVRLAEFEILFVFFFLIVFLLFKQITSRPEYNQLLVKKPGGRDSWPFF